MTKIQYIKATAQDIPFINRVYTENMAALHGIERNEETWKALLSEKNSIYYIVYTTQPVAWFRLDTEEDGLWLGMLQVCRACQRRGIGRAVLSAAETIVRESGGESLGIHTTQDNLAARSLYTACGYTLSEMGPCTTADGVERLGCTFCKKL